MTRLFNAWKFSERRSIRRNAVNKLFTFFIINSDVLLLLWFSKEECPTFIYILSVTIFSRKCIHTRKKGAKLTLTICHAINNTVPEWKRKESRLYFIYMYSCLNEIIASGSVVFKDNSLVSINRTNHTPKSIWRINIVFVIVVVSLFLFLLVTMTSIIFFQIEFDS